MNMKWKLSTLALAAAVSFGASAADVTLSVKGEITPGSCTPTLGASEIDYGTINASTLTAVSPALNQLGVKTVSLAINCTAAVPVGITVTDARADSRLALDGNTYIDNAGATGMRVTSSGSVFGLGKSNNVNVGAYLLSLDSTQISATDSTDTAFTPDVIIGDISRNPISVTNWKKTSAAPLFPHDDTVSDTVLSFARTGTTVPAAIKTATMPLMVSAAVQDVSLFGAAGGESIKMDGNATLSLVYL